jgi:histidine decarboxylase
MDYEELRKRIDPKRSALIICNVSTTFRGAYDSARKILQAFEAAGVQRRQIFLHGDAALGGMILPFLDVESDYRINAEFDSVAVSGHKWIGMPIPCGILLTKRAYVEKMARKVEYLNSQDTTLSGSRNGLAAILLHQTLDQTTEQEWKEKIQRQSFSADQMNTLSNNGNWPASETKHTPLLCLNIAEHKLISSLFIS